MKYLYHYLPDGAAAYENNVHKNALFIMEKQLLDKSAYYCNTKNAD